MTQNWDEKLKTTMAIAAAGTGFMAAAGNILYDYIINQTERKDHRRYQIKRQEQISDTCNDQCLFGFWHSLISHHKTDGFESA